MVYASLSPRPASALRREIDRLFDDVLRPEHSPARTWCPARSTSICRAWIPPRSR